MRANDDTKLLTNCGLSILPSSKINHQKINQNGDLENVTLILNL